jgi:aminoglycoside 3-N-acetyltransferase
MSAAQEVTREDTADGLRELGVTDGDVLLVHSSLSRFGYVVGGADAIIDGLLDAAGPNGTVMVPTHTWDRMSAESPVFDVRETASCVGLVPETLRKRPEAVRGLHPTHSCAAIGPLREELLRDHETQVTPCGSKSPYQRLMSSGAPVGGRGKIVFLGVDLRVNTTFHALEEIACVPWLFDRFEILYTIDYQGRKRPVPSRRHSANMARDFGKMEWVLTGRGVLVRGRIGDAPVRVVDAAGMERVVAPMLAEDPFLLLSREPADRERRRYERWIGERA